MTAPRALRGVTPRLKPSKSEWTEAKSKKAVRVRSGGRCEARLEGCTGHGVHVHHIVRRSQGGSWDPLNLLDCCSFCHLWVHAHPAAAKERGLLG